MKIYIGLDIGGTKIMAASCDESGRELARLKVQTPLSFSEGLELLHSMVAELSGSHKILGIGAAAGGPLDPETGIISPLHQPEWRDVPIKEIMEKKWNAPFYVDVDTNVAALGEYHIGRYTKKHFLYITLSTGMGAGYLIDGKIYQGKSHPEMGHQVINFRCKNPERAICECGGGKCLEAFVSGNGIRRVYGKPAEHLLESEWDEVAYNLGQGLRNISTILSPDIIVIGGGIAVGAGENFLNKAKDYMIEGLKIVSSPEIKLSSLGYDTALSGACFIATGKHL